MVTQPGLFRKNAGSCIVKSGDGNRQFSFGGDTSEYQLGGIFLSQGSRFISHDDCFGFLYGVFVVFTEIGQGEEGVNQFFLAGQCAEQLAFRYPHGMYAANDNIVFFQLPVNLLNLCRCRATADTEVGHGVVTAQHLLEIVSYG